MECDTKKKKIILEKYVSIYGRLLYEAKIPMIFKMNLQCYLKGLGPLTFQSEVRSLVP